MIALHLKKNMYTSSQAALSSQTGEFDLQKMIIHKLNVPHGNVANAKRAFDTLLDNYQKNHQIHEGRISRLYNQIHGVECAIQENSEWIERMSDPAVCTYHVKQKEQPIVIDLNEKQSEMLVQQTQDALTQSRLITESVQKIKSQEQHDTTQIAEANAKISRLRLDAEEKQININNLEREIIAKLKGIDDILKQKSRINSVRSGRFSSMGYRKSTHDAGDIAGFISSIKSGFDLLNKQKSQIILEKESLQRKIMLIQLESSKKLSTKTQ